MESLQFSSPFLAKTLFSSLKSCRLMIDDIEIALLLTTIDFVKFRFPIVALSISLTYKILLRLCETTDSVNNSFNIF